MRLLTRRTPPTWRRAVVTVGVFDGVHLAHQRLIRRTVRLAKRLRAASIAVTFHPDPHQVLAPREAPPALMSLEARLGHLRALGLDAVRIIRFTRAYARTSADAFARRVLVGELRARVIVVGDAFTFGRGRRGTVRTLRQAAAEAGARVVAIAPVMRGGAPVSASRIRRLIQDGDLRGAAALLGRPPTVRGRIVRGSGRGRRLGFPTANLRLNRQIVPPQGVYAVRASFDARPAHRWAGVMNLGVRPTFGGGPVLCEVHLLGARGAFIGRALSLDLIRRLRGERCFPSSAALQAQIRRDIARARRILARRPGA